MPRVSLLNVLTYDHGCAEFCPKNLHAASILDEVVACFLNQNVPKPICFCMVHNCKR